LRVQTEIKDRVQSSLRVQTEIILMSLTEKFDPQVNNGYITYNIQKRKDTVSAHKKLSKLMELI
jgi:hypothetical protein